ncbi:MAG: bifunctional nuclease family protein, partial [Chloroflexi bacterium]|nr:bifunctional nuclease family protein [Chloroflexota bacterium]
QGITPERPLTHDLLAAVIEELGATVREVVIADLTDETFHARILLDAAGQLHEIDSRPSDALALAVRAGVPIFAAESVLERASVQAERDEESQEVDDERLSVFREFVNSLDVEPGSDEAREGPPRE